MTKARVGILATGLMELVALPTALARLFDDGEIDHDFFPIWSTEGETPFSGFTSNTLPPPTEDHVHNALDKLIAEAAGQLARSDQRDRMIVILDDVELPNMMDPTRITVAVRHAVERYIENVTPPRGVSSADFQDQTRAMFRTRVSFHLAAPMIEAWLFADPEAVERAGASGEHPVLVPIRDPEHFRTDDRAYLTFDSSQCVKWTKTQMQQLGPRRVTKSKLKANKPAWIGEFDRGLHPKAYLAWLCRDLQHKRCSTYRETAGRAGRQECGALALSMLDWGEVLRVPSHCTFARALLSDLAEFLGVENKHAGEVHPLTCRKFDEDGEFVLRNL